MEYEVGRRQGRGHSARSEFDFRRSREADVRCAVSHRSCREVPADRTVRRMRRPALFARHIFDVNHGFAHVVRGDSVGHAECAGKCELHHGEQDRHESIRSRTHHQGKLAEGPSRGNFRATGVPLATRAGPRFRMSPLRRRGSRIRSQTREHATIGRRLNQLGCLDHLRNRGETRVGHDPPKGRGT